MARQTRSDKKISKNIPVLDRAAKLLISTIDPGYSERELISQKDSKIQAAISRELDMSKGISDGHIIDFIQDLKDKSLASNDKVSEINLFTEDIGNLFGYYQELNRNRYLDLADLRFLSKFIPAIGEAVNVTLDAIVSSDEYADTISRNIVMSPSLTEIEKTQLMTEITSLEKSLSIPSRLKNTVYKNALIAGEYYVYVVPYADLFNEYSKLNEAGAFNKNILVNSDKNGNNTKNRKSGFVLKKANESEEFILEGASESTFDYDKYTRILDNIAGESFTENEKKEVRSVLEENLSHITTVDTIYLLDALEGYHSADLTRQNLKSYSNAFANMEVQDEKVTNSPVFADGIMDNKGSQKFHTTGSYIKYINANKIVPITIYNTTIGYFYVHDTSVNQKSDAIKKGSSDTGLLSSTSNIFSSTKLNESKKDRATKAIVDSITDGILANFSDKFVNKHADFKNLIADCIIANGLVNNSFQIQFIPANHIIPFTINTLEDGRGVSILNDAIYPAKLLLSLLVSKLLNYMNNGGQRTIAYVKKGPINVNSSNHSQRVLRMLQEGNIVFSDLLSTNVSFAKLGRNKNMQIPRSPDGSALIDFEVQEAQDVSMDTEMERYLEKQILVAMGVPPTLMGYVEEIERSKTVATQNVKFASRTASQQSDLETPTTRFYRCLLLSSNLDDSIKEKLAHGFEYKLSRPKVLANANMSDNISTVQSSAEAIVNLRFGTDDDPDNPDLPKIKQHFMKELVMNMLPFMDWDTYDKLEEKARIAVIKEKDLSNKDNDMGSTPEGDETSLDTSADDTDDF